MVKETIQYEHAYCQNKQNFPQTFNALNKYVSQTFASELHALGTSKLLVHTFAMSIIAVHLHRTPYDVVSLLNEHGRELVDDFDYVLIQAGNLVGEELFYGQLNERIRDFVEHHNYEVMNSTKI